MLDIQIVREDTERVLSLLQRKKFTFDLDLVLDLDRQRRAAVTVAEAGRANQKAANQEMASLPKGSPEFLAKVAEMKELSIQVKGLETEAKDLDQKWLEVFQRLPNIPDESAPIGKGEADNQELRRSTFQESDFAQAKPHYDLPHIDHWIDFERGTKVAGAGFPFYRGEMAQLVRSLIHFFLQEASQKEYGEIWAPLLVNEDSARATGQLPDKEGQMYSCQEENLYLIPTAEVPVTNFYRGEILTNESLPRKHCAYTPCFRREAGSWGKDVRGLNRLHQFDKVEIVRWERPEDSGAAHLELLQDAESLLQKLGLPYRVLEICTGDMGFPHSRQFDLEVWAGGQKRWLEVSSCSNFTDFQARRANIRFRREAGGRPEFLHTLNGSALAVPRVLAAILENGFDGNDQVLLPEVLHSIFGNKILQLSI